MKIGNIFAKNVDSVTINQVSLTNPSNSLTVIVTDTTDLLRVNNHTSAHFSTVTWTVNKLVTGVKINSIESKMEFSIFPNPSNNNITVKATSDKKNSAIVDIIDVNGRNCYHFEDQNANKNEFQYDINLSSFARGTYFLRLQIGDVSDTRTFIKH